MNKILITLSGIDGAGKSTQLRFLRDYLESKNHKVKYLWTRGGNTPGMNLLKDILRKIAGKRLPSSGHSSKRDEMLTKPLIQKLWLTIAIFDLARIYGINIRWFMFNGYSVVCDRYIWDTLIDFKIMFPNINIEKWLIWKILIYITPIPYRSVLLMIPLEISEKRCDQKYEPFPDTPERRRRRYNLYETSSHKKYWDIIDSTKTEEAVFNDIINNFNSNINI